MRGSDAGWRALCAVTELPTGSARVMDADGVPVALVNTGDAIHALLDRCSHDGFALFGCGLDARQLLDGGQVICPRHGARFCLETGAALTPPAVEPLARFDTRVVDGRVEVRVGN